MSSGAIDRHGPGIRTRFLLLISLVLVIAGTTASSLYIIRSRMQRHVLTNLEEDLQHSVETFQDLATVDRDLEVLDVEHCQFFLPAKPCF